MTTFFISDIRIRQISFCLLFCFWHQVLYIQAFVLVFLLGKFMRKVFFGQLRAAEMEVELCFFSITSFKLLCHARKALS